MVKYKCLVLQESFSPNTTASATCMEYIAKELNKRNITIDFYVQKLMPDEIDKKSEMNNVFYIESSYNNEFFKYINKYGSRAKIKTWRKIINPKITLPRIIYRNTDAGTATIRIKNLLEKVRMENDRGQYTHMISVCYPYGTLKLASFIKKEFPNIRWLHFMMDPYEYNYDLPKCGVKKRKRLFKKYSSNLDSLITVKGIEDENKRRNYDNGKRCILTEVSLPNLHKPRIIIQDINTNSDGEIRLLYAGTFYKKIRNPQKMFGVINLLTNEKIKLELYGASCGYFSRYCKEQKRVVLKGQCTSDILNGHISKANILVNLSNTIPNQTPSKVFEYISTGKPIINFFFNEDDSSLYYLEKYPLAFNLNLNSHTKKDIAEMQKFIERNRDIHIPFEKATEHIKESLSENVVRKISSILLEENCE